jgi:uncharacterized membrane protein (UPF0127 family)
VKLLNGATVVAEEVERATSVAQRLKGLLGREEVRGAFVIEPCTSIHTFFMRFAIDAVFVDARGQVLRAIRGMKPWRMSRIYPSAAMVIELPAGTVERTGTREGDVLSFV